MAIKLSALTMQERPKSRGKPVKPNVTGPTTLAECAALLKQQGAAVAILAVQDLQAYWLSIMSSDKASYKDKLTASRLYADSVGAFDRQDDSSKRGPARYVWGDGEQQEQPLDVEIINDSSDNTV